MTSLFRNYKHTFEYLRINLYPDEDVTDLYVNKPFYTGEHTLVVYVNGKENGETPFDEINGYVIDNCEEARVDLNYLDATEHYIKTHCPQDIAQYSVDTLKDWLRVMTESQPNAHINLRTHKLLMELYADELHNAIVFDNAGGLQFDIWKFDTREQVSDMLQSDTLRDDLVYGYILDGEQILTDYQKEHPHWDLDLTKK